MISRKMKQPKTDRNLRRDPLLSNVNVSQYCVSSAYIRCGLYLFHGGATEFEIFQRLFLH
uniref:Uncharacterized protein n=1 Tax=Rhizophora mucronata TaxID=61149 RepID=A0A2P2P2M6_RHIMU